jgi:hypothetical protein
VPTAFAPPAAFASAAAFAFSADSSPFMQRCFPTQPTFPLFAMAKRPRSPSDGVTSAPSTVLASAASAAAADPLLSLFAQELRVAGVSCDEDDLYRLAALGRNKGVMCMEDLRGLDEADVRASVAHMGMTPMQLNKLMKRLGELEVRFSFQNPKPKHPTPRTHPPPPSGAGVC